MAVGSGAAIEERNEYVERLKAKLYPRLRQLNGQLDLTHRCNLDCRHCFIVQEQSQGELELEQITSILDDICAAGVLGLTFSGGEPFLREDFLDIYTYARKKGFLISICTNGTLITPQIADYLAELPPYSIEMTLNGITAVSYEKVTAKQGSFARAIRAIRLLRGKGLPLVIKTNGMKINYAEILKIKAFSEELLGKGRFRFDPVLYAKRDGSKAPCSLRLTPEEALNIQYSDRDMLASCQAQLRRHPQGQRRPTDHLLPCSLSGFQIDPSGRMRLCSFLQEPYVDLKQEKFHQGVIRLYTYFRGLKFQTDSKCRHCEISYLCRQCPGRALVETGSMETPVEYFCRLAHRQEEMRQEVLKKKCSRLPRHLEKRKKWPL